MTDSAGHSAAGPRGRATQAGERLTAARERALQILGSGRHEFTRADYERLAHVSRSQAAHDLAELVEARVLERVGSGHTTRYRAPARRSGRPRSWTSARIRRELESFCAGRGTWPAASEFRAAGRWDLYLAVTRYGGIERWAAELGLSRTAAEPSEGSPGAAAPADGIRRRIGLALAAAVFLAAGAASTFGWSVRGSEKADLPTPRPATAAASHSRQPRAPLAAGPSVSSGHVRVHPVALRLVGIDGDSRVVARRRTGNGRLLFAGLLRSSASLELTGRRIWLSLDAPDAVRLFLDGRPADVPLRARTVLVTTHGVRVLAAPTTAPPQQAPPPPPTAPPTIQVSQPSVATTASTPTSTAPAPPSSPAPPTTSTVSSGGGPAPDGPPTGPVPDPKPR